MPRGSIMGTSINNCWTVSLYNKTKYHVFSSRGWSFLGTRPCCKSEGGRCDRTWTFRLCHVAFWICKSRLLANSLTWVQCRYPCIGLVASVGIIVAHRSPRDPYIDTRRPLPRIQSVFDKRDWRIRLLACQMTYLYSVQPCDYIVKSHHAEQIRSRSPKGSEERN
jgi:hypothetical protein